MLGCILEPFDRGDMLQGSADIIKPVQQDVAVVRIDRKGDALF